MAGKASALTSAPVCGTSIPDPAVILRIAHPLDQLGGHGPVDEPDSAVVSQQEVVGDLAHGGPRWSGCPRTARSSCCCAEVSPTTSACCSLERRNRRIRCAAPRRSS